MAPTASSNLLRRLSIRDIIPRNVLETQTSSQWRNPNDILSLLLLIGPEIVQRAVTQMSGGSYGVTPVAFSFGWAAYAVGTLMGVLGDGRLVPKADYDVLVVAAESGHVRTNKSWVIGRLLRDFEDKSNSGLQRNVQPSHPIEQRVRSEIGNQTAWEALRISVFQFDSKSRAPQGKSKGDWLSCGAFVVIIMQLCIGLIPWILHDEWEIFVITAIGTTLCLAEGSLPQWKSEKWPCPSGGGATVSITQGNGSRHVMVIVGGHDSPDLEILSTGSGRFKASNLTRASVPLFALAWGIMLITVAGIKQYSWYLLGIGLVGMIQNLVAAGAKREPSSLGFHLEALDTFTGSKVTDVLKEVETKYRYVGTSLIPIFFPGSMRVPEEEIEFWAKAEKLRKSTNEHGVVKKEQEGEKKNRVQKERRQTS